jgi:RNA polymerase sigma-70 factor (ECF subfamily)
MEITTDLAVVSRARTGDADAFRLLVESHSKAAFRVAYRMTGNEHDADDVVQETFLRAYRQLRHFEERAKVRMRLKERQQALADFVRDGRHPQESALVARVFGGRGAGRTEPQQDRLLMSADLQKHVAEAMERLSSNERTAFVLRHFEGMPVEEIGKTLGIQVNAAKHTIFRAVRKLRESLEPFVRPKPCNT